MFPISVKEVPGWLVSMPPSWIGVPVACTPGLVPHCDVLTALLELLDAELPAEELPDEPPAGPPPHAARPSIPKMAAAATAARAPGA